MKICILVLTYKRNNELFRLLGQIEKYKNTYSGKNEYFIWIADSDNDNTEAANIERLCNRVILNPGIGFDTNIFNFFEKYSFEFDFTLTISDDDLFSISDLSPFSFIDLAAESKRNIILFNHCDYKWSESNNIIISGNHYNNPEFKLNKSYIAKYFMQCLPRHVGIMYSKKSIQRCITYLHRFKYTEHLYAVPFLMGALEEDVFFFDYPLFYFSVIPNGGAWENLMKVFEGLLKFLIEIRGFVNENQYIIAKEGFLRNYLGGDAWLRKYIEGQGWQLQSHEEIMRLI